MRVELGDDRVDKPFQSQPSDVRHIEGREGLDAVSTMEADMRQRVGQVDDGCSRDVWSLPGLVVQGDRER